MAATLLDRAERAGLVVWAFADGTAWASGPEDADPLLVAEVLSHGSEIAAEIDRRTPTDAELQRLKGVRSRHRTA